MSKPEYIEVDGTRYVRQEQQPTGDRAVIVADRGWIFAGDVTEKDGRIQLARAVNVQRWSGIGFDGMLRDPSSDKVTIKKLSHTVDFPQGSELFRCRVGEEWGL